MTLTPTFQRKVDLLYLLTRKEIALKYKRTVLGIFWSLLNPLLMAIVFFIAFKIFMRFQIENYTFFLLSALFPWNWFLSSMIISSRSLVDNVTLIKKVVFPRQYLVASVLLAQMIHLLFSIPILVGLSSFGGPGPSLSWIIGIPLLILVQWIFTFGIASMVAIGNTYFHDIEYLVGILLNLTFWVTPITYPLSSIPANLKPFFLLNPLTSLIACWRGLFLENKILWKELGIAFLFSLILFQLGRIVFN
ncbi:MAG: ABC transporter permease, partial [Elusimicrobia bacterium]|nr:ABC transporter permease [Elusimicrobiota bacterium]